MCFGNVNLMVQKLVSRGEGMGWITLTRPTFHSGWGPGTGADIDPGCTPAIFPIPPISRGSVCAFGTVQYRGAAGQPRALRSPNRVPTATTLGSASPPLAGRFQCIAVSFQIWDLVLYV